VRLPVAGAGGWRRYFAPLRPAGPELVAGGIPLAWLLLRCSSVLAPRATAWLAGGDAASHWVGWLFFAREPWHWPPGRIASWFAPVGTTVGFADAIPLLAFPLKLVATWFAGPFQYFGLWIATCVVLQGVFGSRLLAELGAGERLRALGGALLAFGPVLWHRFDAGHFSLAAQWLILAAFLAWARFFRSGGRVRYLLWLAALPVLAAAIHPYLTLVTGALLAAIVPAAVRFGRRRVLTAGGVLAGAALAAVAVAGLAGFLGTGSESLQAGAWGGYSADLAAFLNPERRSRFFPELFSMVGYGEGFAYLGCGGLVAGAVGLALRQAERRRVRSGATTRRDAHGWRALWIACAVLAAIAALPKVRIFGFEVLSARAFTSLLEVPLGPFRANGRLIWPLHALLLVSAVSWLRPLEAKKARSLTLLLAFALVAQAAEPHLWNAWASPASDLDRRVGELSRRLPAAGRVRLLPPFLRDGDEVFCGGTSDGDAWVAAACLAARLGASFDSGYVARLDDEVARATCADGAARLAGLRLEPGTIHVVRPRLARILRRRGFDCERLSRQQWACLGPPAAAQRSRGAGQGATADQ